MPVVALAVLGFLRAFLSRDRATGVINGAVRLACWLMLSLEFALATDILRTALNFSLQREMEQPHRPA